MYDDHRGGVRGWHAYLFIHGAYTLSKTCDAGNNLVSNDGATGPSQPEFPCLYATLTGSPCLFGLIPLLGVLGKAVPWQLELPLKRSIGSLYFRLHLSSFSLLLKKSLLAP